MNPHGEDIVLAIVCFLAVVALIYAIKVSP